MTSERGFRRTVLLTALAGQMAYAMAAEKPGLAIVSLLATALSWWLVRQTLAGKPRPLPRALLNGLVITAILHLLLQLLGHTQEPITSLTDFLAYVMLVKSLDRVRMRDEAQLLGLSLFVVIGALLTGQSLAMGLALLAYTPLAINATVSLQLYAALERQHDLLKSVGLGDQAAALDAQLERQHAPRATATVATVCIVASMAAGVIAFIITPRQLAQQLGMAAAPFMRSQSTDFSDSITLGKAGNISQDNTPVMDVRPVSDAGTIAIANGPIYLRGAVLTHYNAKNGKWSGATDNENAIEQPGDGVSEPPVSSPFVNAETKDARNRTQYEIVQRNTKPNQDVLLFAPLMPAVVATAAEGKIVYRPSDSLLRFKSNQVGGRLVYNVTSVTDYRKPNAGAERPSYQSKPKIEALAKKLLADRTIPADPYTAGPLEVRRAAQAVIAHLSSFPYTLDMIAPNEDEDPIEMFLFRTKKGHCEYFAAGMVALLRASGIPARIATGYVAAEFNDVSGYYTVRKSDAHAWVEVEMEPGRWDTFDPTPPGELQSTLRASAGPLGWIKHVWDAIEFSWLDNVVAYDKGLKLDVGGFGAHSDPGAAAAKWQQRLASIQAWLKSHLPQNVITRSLLVGSATFMLVMAVYGVVRVGNKTFAPLRTWLTRFLPGRKRADADELPIPPDATFYKDALHALTTSGVPKPAPAPPLTFADTLTAGAAGPLRTIADLYYRSRFGGTPLSAEQQSAGRAALAQLRAALANVPRPRT